MSTPLTSANSNAAARPCWSLYGRRTPATADIGKLIEQRSNGAIAFQMASLYPLLYASNTVAGSAASGSENG